MAQLSGALRKYSNDTRNTVEVDFGEGGKATLYAKPLTAAEMEKIMARHPKFVERPSLAATVDLIIMKARVVDSDELAFDIGDKADLMAKPLDWLNAIRKGLFPENDVDMTDDAISEEMGN